MIEIGIQLCDILDYLHHRTPCPILHQDLKPEHILLCGNQVKIIDFGIASFFSDSGNHFQIYGTRGYAAPEVLSHRSCGAVSDLYSLGRVLAFLAEHATFECPPRLLALIRAATADDPVDRPASAAEFRSALIAIEQKACSSSSHLIRNMAVIGTRQGCGATHVSIAMTATLNRLGIRAVYTPVGDVRILENLAEQNPRVREEKGIYQYGSFRGIPDYGNGVESLLSPDDCAVRDFGCCADPADCFTAYDLILVILAASDWDLSAALCRCSSFALLPQTVFLCNWGNRAAARKAARLLGKPVWCFPFDPDPFRRTREKDRLISAILHQKGGNHHSIF
jgi:serine/threonine-protein kinase